MFIKMLLKVNVRVLTDEQHPSGEITYLLLKTSNFVTLCVYQ